MSVAGVLRKIDDTRLVVLDETMRVESLYKTTRV